MNPQLTPNTRRARALAALLLGLSVLSGTSAPDAEAQTVTLNWVEWDPPGSYGNTGNTPSSFPTSYKYAATTTGELQLPNGPRVYIRLTGEIVIPTLDGPADTNCTGYCGPSGFTSNSTTRSSYWQTYPYGGGGASGTGTGAGTAFVSTNVPLSELPPNGDHIGLVGASLSAGGNPTQVLEFFSDSARTIPTSVENIVMLVGSLGAGPPPVVNAVTAVWDFSQDFDILSTNTSDVGASASLTRTVKVPGGTGADFQLSGEEGTGAIQFVGTFTRISWTVSAPEVWASWNISASSTPTARAASQTPPSTADAPTPTLALDCTPDPVQPGATVSCEVSGGDAGIDILWRAAIDLPFAEQGVTLDAVGRGVFTFTAPLGAGGRVIDVVLVDWGVTDTVTVTGPAVPVSVPAGDGPRVPAEMVASIVLALGLIAAGRRRAR